MLWSGEDAASPAALVQLSSSGVVAVTIVRHELTFLLFPSPFRAGSVWDSRLGQAAPGVLCLDGFLACPCHVWVPLLYTIES